MIFFLILISTVVLTTALEPANKIDLGDEKVRSTFSKYLDKIPDIVDQYVVDERISRALSHYFDGKLSAFPLFKINVRIDRNPVKIPWTAAAPKIEKEMKKRSHNKRRPTQKVYRFITPVNRSLVHKREPKKDATKKLYEKTETTTVDSETNVKVNYSEDHREQKNNKIIVEDNEKVYRSVDLEKDPRTEKIGAEKDLQENVTKDTTNSSQLPFDVSTANVIETSTRFDRLAMIVTESSSVKPSV